MIRRIVLDWQHTGKPSSPRDVGAVHRGLTEVEVTGRYIGAARAELHAYGHEVVVISDGEYSARAARCNALKPALYLACHVNAASTPTDYGAVFYWPTSTNGRAAADAIVVELRKVFPEQDWRVIAATAGMWDRVRACVGGVVAPAVLLEPAFITGQIGHALCRDRAEDIGRAIAAGVERWLG